MSAVVVKEIDNLDKAVTAVKKYEDRHFIKFDDEDSLLAFTEKQLEYGHFMAAFMDDELSGYICFYSNDMDSRTAYVTSMSVGDHGLISGRIFCELVGEAVRVAVGEGMNKVKVQVHKDNLHARKLYEKLGFEYIEKESEEVLMLISMERLINVLRIRIDSR